LINRFRIFAGPNGSGKSTLFEQLKATGQIHTGIYVNADKIEIKTITIDQIHPMTKYQLKDLQDIAEKLKLPLETTKYGPDNKSFRIIKKTSSDSRKLYQTRQST
jgi:predicted ABC-type ATPase